MKNFSPFFPLFPLPLQRSLIAHTVASLPKEQAQELAGMIEREIKRMREGRESQESQQ